MELNRANKKVRASEAVPVSRRGAPLTASKAHCAARYDDDEDDYEDDRPAAKKSPSGSANSAYAGEGLVKSAASPIEDLLDRLEKEQANLGSCIDQLQIHLKMVSRPNVYSESKSVNDEAADSNVSLVELKLLQRIAQIETLTEKVILISHNLRCF
jgi:hypothetical protein